MFYEYVSRYKTLKETTSSCLGGDDLLGLMIAEKGANVTVGDVIVGRASGAFFGKVCKNIHFGTFFWCS